MLRNSFLSLSARHYAFSRWLMARQPVTMQQQAASDHVPFIPPMAPRPENYGLPVAVQDLPDQAPDDLSLVIGSEIESVIREPEFTDDVMVPDEASFAPDRFIVTGVLPAETGVPERPVSVGHAHPEAPPSVSSPPAPANVIRAPAVPSVAAPQDVTSRITRANDVRDASGITTRVSGRDSVADPPRAPAPAEQREQPVTFVPAPAQPQTVRNAPPDGGVVGIADQPAPGNISDLDVGNLDDRNDTTQRPQSETSAPLTDAFVVAPVAPHVADAQRVEPDANADSDHAIVPSRREAMSEETPRDQSRAMGKPRDDARHDDTTRRQTAAVGVAPGMAPQEQTAVTGSARVNPRPAVSAIPSPPAATTRWQQARRFIQRRLSKNAGLPRPVARPEASRNALAPRPGDTPPRVSGPSLNPPAVPPTQVAAPGEVPTGSSVSPTEMPPRDSLVTQPDTTREQPSRIVPPVSLASPTIASAADTTSEQPPRIVPDSADMPRLSNDAAQELPAQRASDPLASAPRDTPTLHSAVIDQTARSDEQSREPMPAAPAINEGSAQPSISMRTDVGSVVGGPDTTAALAPGSVGAGDHAAIDTTSARQEPVNTVEGMETMQEDRSRGTETLAPTQAEERAPNRAVERPQQQREAADTRQSEDSSQLAALSLSQRDQSPSGQPVVSSATQPDQSDQPAPAPQGVRDAGDNPPLMYSDRQETRPDVAEPLPLQPRADARPTPPSAVPPMQQEAAQRAAPTQGAPQRPFIAPSQPVRPRPVTALPRAARTLAAWLSPRQDRDQTPPHAEQAGIPSPPVQTVENIGRDTPDRIGTQSREIADVIVDALSSEHADATEIPSPPRTVSASTVPDPQPDLVTRSEMPPPIGESIVAPIRDAKRDDPGRSTALPDAREPQLPTPGLAETAVDTQADERSAATPLVRDTLPEDQAARPLSDSPPLELAGHRPPEDEPTVASPADALSPTTPPGDTARPQPQASPLVAPAIVIEQTSQRQSLLSVQDSTTSVTSRPADSQPAAPPQTRPTSAVPDRGDRPVVAASHETEPGIAAVAEVQPTASSETTASEPPIAQPPHATLAVDVQPVDTQPSGATRDADRSAPMQPGQTPDDSSPPAVSEPTVAPPALASSAPQPASSEVSIERSRVNDTPPRDRADATGLLGAEAAEDQPRQPAPMVPHPTGEPQSVAEDEQPLVVNTPSALAIPEEAVRPDVPIVEAMQPEPAVPPALADLGSFPSSPGPTPQSPGNLSVPAQSSDSGRLPAAPLPAIVLPAQRAAAARAETEGREAVYPASEIVPDEMNQQTDPTIAPVLDFRPAPVPESASDGQPQAQPDLMQLARQLQQIHISASPIATPRVEVSAAPEPQAVLTGDITSPPSNESAATRQPVEIPTAAPADRAVHAAAPAPVISDAQPTVEVAPVVAEIVPFAPPPVPTIALDLSIEPSTDALISAPTAQPPEPVTPTVNHTTPGDAIADELTEQSLPGFIEVRQARRRLILPAPAPPVEAPAPSEAELEMERAVRAEKLAQAARLRRLYFGDTAEETAAPSVDEPPTTTATPAALETVSAASAPAPATPVPAVPTAVTARAVERGATPTPITLPDATRRFLRPLIGFDPRAVPIYRDSATDRLTAEHNADALTDGSSVVVASTNVAMDRPETLGLLAHELTHIARRQHPRFVPPIARTGAQGSRDPMILGERGGERAASLTEESLAERVEERVIRSARTAPLPPPRFSPSSPYLSATTTAREEPPSAAAAPHAVNPDTNWGDLPAPWESVPDWMQHSPSDTGQVDGGAHRQAAPVGAGVPVVQRAGSERSLSGQHEDDPSRHGASDGGANGVEPDLDALARQVYAILKNRLAVERRRTG